MSPKIATTQLQDIQGDLPLALECIVASMQSADKQKADIICFPECFLQGYTLDTELTKERAISLNSDEFNVILQRLRSFKTAAIIGLIEQEGAAFFNSSVVIHEGGILGKYRKVHLFEKGRGYPTFEVNGLKFGINICYDARFSEGALAIAEQGAQIIFYPLNNRLPVEKAIHYRDKHLPNLVNRANDSGCYVISSDVIHKDSETLAYGCSAIINPNGKVLERIPELSNSMLITTLTNSN